MAVGKNKRSAKGKKGTKKKVVDPFTRKDWFDVKAPAIFSDPNVCKTLVNRTQGTRTAEDGLRGRVFEVCLADLNKDEDQGFRKIKLKVEDVKGQECFTNFYGMDMTSDKLRSLVKKWQTLIEAQLDVKTTDGYVLRVFVIGFTAQGLMSTKKHSYANGSQMRRIRRKMAEVVVKEASTCDLVSIVRKFIPESIGKQIEKATESICALQNVFVRRVKVVKAPKMDSAKLMALYPTQGGGNTSKSGEKVARYDDYQEPEILESV